MIPTPAQLAPLVEPIAGPIYESLRLGIDFADQTMRSHDGHFHSHCVRYRTREALEAVEATDWHLVPRIPNSGIHLVLGGGLHTARLLRTLNGGAPHPGRGLTRQRAWTNLDMPIQLPLDLDTIDEVAFAPLSLLLDWSIMDDEPLVHLSLPQGAWSYGNKPRLHWRVLLNDPGIAGMGIEFNPIGRDAQLDIDLEIDDERGEEAAG